MASEDPINSTLQKPLDNNAQAAADVTSMLAELKGESAPKTSTTTNGTSEKPVKNGEKAEEGKDGVSEEDKENTDSRHPDRRENREKDDHDDDQPRDRHDREDRGHRGGRGGRGGRGAGRGRGRGDFKPRHHGRDNIKSNLIKEETSSDPVAIRKQVEFYFSDSNLPTDRFLFTQVGGSANNPVEVTTIHSFKRMRHFQPFEAIITALRDSTFLELCENDTSVRRREPLPTNLKEMGDSAAIKVFEDRAMPRSIYAKGFGEEDSSTQYDIEEFFSPYGPTNAIRLRRSGDKLFKGSVFVEFETEDLQKAFLELETKPQFKGEDLKIMSKKEYCEGKVDDINAGRIRANTADDKSDRKGNWNDRRDRENKRKRDDDRGDDRDWRTRRDEDRRNGFKDDRKRGERENKSGRGHGGGRSRGYEKVEKDERGIPVVKETSPETKRSEATADAIAKARAAVEADKVEQEAKIVKAEEPAATAAAAEKIKTEMDVEAATSKKRDREDEGEAVTQPELKKEKLAEAS